MSKSVFARQRQSIGLDVCSNPVVRDDELQIGQQGWDVAFNYRTIDDFTSRLNDEVGDERISTIGFSCHGNSDGTGGVAIQGVYGPWLDMGHIPQYHSFLTTLNSRLERNAIVYFYSCRMGGSDAGRMLLLRISDILRPRLIVGFTEEGHQAPVQNRSGERCQLPGVQFGQPGRWGSWGLRTAVLARNNQIALFP